MSPVWHATLTDHSLTRDSFWMRSGPSDPNGALCCPTRGMIFGCETWSAIEYAAHSRDITALHVFGVDQALRLDEPVIPEIAADELIEEASATYATADPGLVASELGDQARLLADLAEAAGPASWTRGITIGDSRRDVRSLLEHALHDSHHHLVDVEDGLSVLRARTR